MIIIEKSFFGRLKQTLIIFTTNVNITIYYLLFSIISVFVLSLLGSYIFSLSYKFLDIKNGSGIDINSYVNMGYFGVIYSIISLSVAILKFPFYISFVKNISDAYKGNNFDKIENLKFGFARIFKILNTYRYIFKYVALIPCLLLIVGLLIIFVDHIVGILIVAFSIFLFIYFAIFRGLRSFSSLMYAVFYDDFSKDSFKKSIEITKYKVGTVFWNYVGIFIVAWFVTYLVNKGINIFIPDNDIISKVINEVSDNINNLQNIQESIVKIVNEWIKSSSSQMGLGYIKKFIDSVVTNLLYVFGVIFYFLLMKRFENEKEVNI
ncbi:hypothetical protein EOM39_07475 [Candidatus Gracilibacteria bacterium]|nr:hypothetical protein [Candidatus Gracilibacteria bacterium]